MKPIWLIISCLFLQVFTMQAQEEVQLQIRLRYSDGTAAGGETIVLEQLPEGEMVPWTAQDNAHRQAQDDACTTDADGLCTWSVTPGLYQILFTRPLDDLSTLAVAEGGLSGFGLTVGDDDIIYSFTFHNDGQVYFDAAPDAALPSPIIPEPDDIHGWPAITAEPAPPVEATTIPSVGITTTQGTVTDRPWRPVLFVLLGGGLLYLLKPRLVRLWSRKQRQAAKKRPVQAPGEEKEA